MSARVGLAMHVGLLVLSVSAGPTWAESQVPRSTAAHAAPQAVLPQRELPEAAALPFMVALGIQNQWHFDQSARIFSNQRLFMGAGLSVTYRLLEIGSALTLSGGVDWQAAATQGAWSLGETSNHGHLLFATALLRYAPCWWSRPFARLSAGARHDSYTLHVEGAPSIRAEAWAPAAAFGLGWGMLSNSRWLSIVGLAVAAALDVEAGLGFAGTQEVRARSTGGGEDTIPVAGPHIARIEGVRPYGRISFGLYF